MKSQVIEGSAFARLQRAREAYSLHRAGRTEREIANRLGLPRPAVMAHVLEGAEVEFERQRRAAFAAGRRSLLSPMPRKAAA